MTRSFLQIDATLELNILLQPITLSETVTVTEDKLMPAKLNPPLRSYHGRCAARAPYSIKNSRTPYPCCLELWLGPDVT